MAEYVVEFNNWRELADKVNLRTWALFQTAEKYLNGAIFQLKRFEEAKAKQPGLQGLLSLEAHSYLVYIDLVGRCFDSICNVNNTDRKLTDFWHGYEDKKDPANLFSPLREARNFVSHINEIVEYAVDIGSSVSEAATFVTVFENGALIYYQRNEIKAKDKRATDVKIWDKAQNRHRYFRFSKKSLPANETEFNKVRTIYKTILSILKQRKKDPKYRKEDPDGYAILCDSVITFCLGPIDRFIGGLVSNSVFQGVLFEER
jgi:hypothetical protein